MAVFLLEILRPNYHNHLRGLIISSKNCDTSLRWDSALPSFMPPGPSICTFQSVIAFLRVVIAEFFAFMPMQSRIVINIAEETIRSTTTTQLGTLIGVA